MNIFKNILKNKPFQKLWLSGFASGTARWIEIFCFSVVAWQTTQDAVIVGQLMTLRMAGVILSAIFFVIFGGNYSGQLVMLLALIACSLGSFAGLVSWLAASNFQMIFSPTANLFTFAFISFCSGALWSVDFSFRRRMLGDSLPKNLVSAGISFDVMSSHATRLIAMLIGGAILTSDSTGGLYALLCITYAISGFFLIGTPDTKFANETIPAKRVFVQVLNSFPLIVVLSLTPIFNIFVLPYLALIAPFLLERFSVGEFVSGSFSALEGLGALVGGVALSLINPVKRLSVFVFALLGLFLSLLLLTDADNLFLVAGLLFFAGILSSTYSAMQSSIIYLDSAPSLRSSTFSLLTIGVGIGLFGTLNVSWLAQSNDVTGVLRWMALEGLIVLTLLISIFGLKHWANRRCS